MSSPLRFAIAISFAGEQRPQIRPVAEQLAERFTPARVLYDHFHKEEFARPDLNAYLPDLYLKQSELIVVILSPDYPKKSWCGLELRYIRELINREPHRVMLLSIGEPGDLSHLGILSGDGYLPIDGMTATDIAASIGKRYLLDRWDVNAHSELWMQGYHIQSPEPWNQVLQPLNPDPQKPEGYVLPEAAASVRAPGVLSGMSGAPASPTASKTVTAVPQASPGKDAVLDSLSQPAARPFLDELIKDLKKAFPGSAVTDAQSLADYYAQCPPEDVQKCFWSIRRAGSRLDANARKQAQRPSADSIGSRPAGW